MKMDEPVRNICVGDLYKVISPRTEEELLIEIIWIGWYEMIIDIYYQNKVKRRRRIQKYTNQYNMNEDNLIFNKSVEERDKYILEWKNEEII